MLSSEYQGKLSPMTNLQPVIIGGDTGAYALAREFNEAFGVKPIVISAFLPDSIRDSEILTYRHCAGANDENALIAELLTLGESLKRENPQCTLLLMANTDWRVAVLAAHREELEQYYVYPGPSAETMNDVGNKETFAHLAEAVGMSVPESFYQDFTGADDSDWHPDEIPADLVFPVIAKPVYSPDYEHLEFEGRKKVYRIDSADELEALWHKLRDAGFRGTFMAQQLIEGDDTYMYSITAYVDSHGEVSMMCSGQVLLEEHNPVTLGNPCAVITYPIPEILEQARAFLTSIEYQGFANFDVKRDPHTGKYYFLEVNPRIGRNSYYCVGAGVNPMEYVVNDLVEHEPLPTVTAEGRVLYTLVPYRLLTRYVLDPDTRAKLRWLRQQRSVVNPLANPADNSLWRIYRRLRGEAKYVRDFAKFYPKPTHTGF